MLATLIQTFAKGHVTYAFSRLKRALISYAIAGLALAIGLGFLIAAGFIYVADRYGRLEAALAFGGGFVLIAIIVLIINAIVARNAGRRRAAEEKATQIKTLAGATVIAMIPALLKGRGWLFELLAPFLALVAYEIYKENAGEPDKDDKPAV